MIGAVQFNLDLAKDGSQILRATTDKHRYIHSQYDPIHEASLLAESWNLDGKKIAVIYGLGLGYHIQACMDRYPSLEHVYILEPYEQIVNLARKVHSEFMDNPRIQIIRTPLEIELAHTIAIFSLENILFHPASVEICPFHSIKELLQESMMIRNTVHKMQGLLMGNWLSNSKDITSKNVLSGQKKRYAEKIGFVLASGPSLEEEFESLRILQNSDAVILAVSANLKRLVAEGINPTAYIMSDGGPIVMNHIDNTGLKEKLPTLLLLSTAYKEVRNSYAGDISWILQEGFSPANEFAMENRLDVFETGGSVATLCLSILHYWGCNPIVFVGQDLAYTGGYSYASGTNHDFMKHIGSNFRNIRVPSVHGELIPTTITWNSFRHWIEAFIELYSDRTYINTSHGAVIKGTMYKPLSQVVDDICRKA